VGKRFTKTGATSDLAEGNSVLIYPPKMAKVLQGLGERRRQSWEGEAIRKNKPSISFSEKKDLKIT